MSNECDPFERRVYPLARRFVYRPRVSLYIPGDASRPWPALPVRAILAF